MTDPETNSPDDLQDRVEDIEDDVEAMDRDDRAIPLPDESGEEDEGAGPVTGIVP
ncbi:MAG: hypothetical protein SWI22_10845 [Pseudomonadota bacterium]|nr:hypothetical protein [Pseudomonadota bacterium]